MNAAKKTIAAEGKAPAHIHLCWREV